MFWTLPWLLMFGNVPSLVRPASFADAPRMASIHAEGFALGWDAMELEAMLARGDHADVLVSRTLLGDIVTGFAMSRQSLDEAELLTIALDPDLRGRGLSLLLLETHAKALRRAGVVSHFLEVAEDNAPAIALYRRAGFTEIGRRKGYYRTSEGRHDALTMKRDLSALDPTPRAR